MTALLRKRIESVERGSPRPAPPQEELVFSLDELVGQESADAI